MTGHIGPDFRLKDYKLAHLIVDKTMQHVDLRKPSSGKESSSPKEDHTTAPHIKALITTCTKMG